MLQLTFSIILLIKVISATYSNEFHVSKLNVERHNVLNKGVWTRHNIDRDIEARQRGSDFIFNQENTDNENLLSDNKFFDNNIESLEMVPSYFERYKRSTEDKLSNKKAMETTYVEPIEMNEITDTKLISKSKIDDVNRYNLIQLLGKERDHYDFVPDKNLTYDNNNITKINTNRNKTKDVFLNTIDFINLVDGEDVISSIEILAKNTIPTTTEIAQNNTPYKDVNSNKFNRDISSEKVFSLNLPTTDFNPSVIPRNQEQVKNPKHVSERGLIKILGTLTRTLKKIIYHHNNIKAIHDKLMTVNTDIDKNMETMSKNFLQFDIKYENLVQIMERLKMWEAKLIAKDEYFCDKENEIYKKLKGYEESHKKFLEDQKIFYNTQKSMLDQIEKINLKQNLIAKTQSEISHRQNHFARIFKKAKQILSSGKKKILPSSNSVSTNERNTTTDTARSKIGSKYIVHSTTPTPQTTEQVKINLFSIPHLVPLSNKDEYLLRDKDDHSIDDLVFKYYFNNTFVEKFIKNNLLLDYVATPESSDLTSKVKSKRNRIDTTILFPLNPTIKEDHQRHRRWIRHSKKKIKKNYKVLNFTRNHNLVGSENALQHPIGDGNDHINNIKVKAFNLDHTKNKNYDITKKREYSNNIKAKVLEPAWSVKRNADTSPFLAMAENFCNGIGQNVNRQVFNWCVEKSIRRLGNIDFKIPTPNPAPAPPSFVENNLEEDRKEKESSPADIATDASYTYAGDNTVGTVTEPSMTTFVFGPRQTSPIFDSVFSTSQNIFFPDNDELEKNLKNYDMKKDTEGTVYYDGSLHTSDMALDNSEGFSDMIVPDLDSDSRIQVDTKTLDFQIKRHALLQQQRRQHLMKSRKKA